MLLTLQLLSYLWVLGKLQGKVILDQRRQVLGADRDMRGLE